MTEITYTQVGDYLIPNIITADDETNLPTLTRWGNMRLGYLKNHCRVVYNELLLSGKLFSHCYEIEVQAKERMEFMMEQAAKVSPVSEDLKNTDLLAWVGNMNALKFQVEEVIKAELIYE